MTGLPYAPAGVSDVQRDYVVQVLSAAFATDRLSMEQLDKRLSAVYRARSLGDLEVLLADPAETNRSLADEASVNRVVADPVVPEIEIFALMGGVEIFVPIGVRVEVTGMAVMGGFSVSGAEATEDPHAPVLRISGLAVMGGVDVKHKGRGKQSEKRYLQALERAQKLQLRSGG